MYVKCARPLHSYKITVKFQSWRCYHVHVKSENWQFYKRWKLGYFAPKNVPKTESSLFWNSCLWCNIGVNSFVYALWFLNTREIIRERNHPVIVKWMVHQKGEVILEEEDGVVELVYSRLTHFQHWLIVIFLLQRRFCFNVRQLLIKTWSNCVL